jgi:hypothetical protein
MMTSDLKQLPLYQLLFQVIFCQPGMWKAAIWQLRVRSLALSNITHSLAL